MANIGGVPILFGSCAGTTPTLPEEITVDAIDLEEGADYLVRSAALNSVLDSKLGIFSAWIRIDGGDNTTRYIFTGGNDRSILVDIDSSNNIGVFCENNTSPRVLMESSSAFTAGATWLHVLASWDVANTAHLYINDVNEDVVPSVVNAPIGYSTSFSWSVCADTNGSREFEGCVAEVYFAPGQYLDFSVEENRRLFISENGKPVDLETDGSGPTGQVPAVYLHLDDSEDPTNFVLNAGGGGDFGHAGVPTTADSSPSD